MKIYKIYQNVNNGYDTYSDAVVCAKDEDEARMIHPSTFNKDWGGKDEEFGGTWADAEFVKVECIGEAKEGLETGIICSSFHAG